MDFEINLIFLIELFFLHDQKVVTRSSFLKGFQLSKIAQTWEWAFNIFTSMLQGSCRFLLEVK